MHIAEGILSPPVLLAGGMLAGGGVALGLRTMRDEEIPQTALLTAVFFIASLIHVPLGPGSIHLTLTGLCGLVLGWRAFPAVLIALLLQAVLFGFGGMLVLGANTAILAAPAVAAGIPLRRWIARRPARAAIAGALAGGFSILASASLAALALASSHRSFMGAAALLLAGSAPLALVEAIITAGLAQFLARLRPELFQGTRSDGLA